jgi:tetratricopeptide (TPR) repeat protein
MGLLERASFLQTLAEYAGEARQGDGRLVLVSGESGIGKTALVEMFQHRVKGARWLWGACDGLLTPRPLGPVFDIGAQVGGELADLCRRGAQRDQLFAAFMAEIDSPGALTVAVIEDVHWADEATIDLLSFLGRRLARMTALVLATYRDDELGDDHPLRMVLGDLATQRATRRMGLPPLSPDAVRALAEERGVDADELYRVTGGNPFYVREILEAGWPSVPPTVRDAVGARLARSSSGSRRAGGDRGGDRCAGGPIAPVAGPERLEFIARRVPGDRNPRCRRDRPAIPARARPDGGRGSDRAAPEDKTARTPAGRAGGARRCRSRPARPPRRRRRGCEGRAAARPEAARQSSALGAHREAAAQFERGLRFADESDRPALASLYEGLAGEYSLLDRWEEAERPLRAALGVRRELGDDLNVGADLRLLSKTLWRLCRGDDAGRAAGEAVLVLETLPPGRELAWAYANLSAFHMDVGRDNEAIGIGEKARDLGERLRQPDVVSNALNTIGCGAVNSGRDGMGSIEQALQIALDADLQEAVGRAYCNLQSCSTSLNRFAESERYYAEGMAYCEERELGVFSTCLMGGRANTLLRTGHWDEAADICTQALDRQRSSPREPAEPA